MLQTFSHHQWDPLFTEDEQKQAITSIESGQIIYFPQLSFNLSVMETEFLSPHYVDPQAKHISYHHETNKLWGVQRLSDDKRYHLKMMLERFTWQTDNLLKQLFPRYKNHLKIARTSFRTSEVCERKTSYRKDDRLLHVDAFPSAPNQGQRILRVFSNINPHGEDRVWRVGEPFETVASQFLPTIKKPIPGLLAALRFLKITKSYRSLYDHYMLRLHDRMKANGHYQKDAQHQEIRFSPGSSWIVQTDHVSHAAIHGRYVMEQTFSLPVQAMENEAASPLRTLEKLLNRALT